MAMRMIDRLQCSSSVELQRNQEAKVILEIDLTRKAASTGSVEQTQISRSWNRFLVSDGYVFRFGSRFRLSSGFFNKCKLAITNALLQMGADEIGEDSKRDLLDYVYNISKRVIRLPIKEVVIRADIEIVAVFQSQSEAFGGRMITIQPQPQVSYSRSRLDESLVFIGDLTLMSSQSQGVDGARRRQSPAFDGSARHSNESLILGAVVLESVLLAEQRGFTPVPATEAALEKLVTEDFKKEETMTGDPDGRTCTICLDGLMDDGMQFKRMPCNHVFHEGCIFTWLKQNNSCPLCRFRLQE